MINAGNQVRIARKKSGLTQEELAERIGKNSNLLARWERGEVEMKVDTIMSIAKALNLSISQLLEDDTSSKNNIPSMSYWGGVLDNIRQIAKRKDMEEIELIYPLLKSGYEILTNVKNTVIDNLTEQHVDIQQNNIGRDATVNFGTIQTVTGD